MVGQVTLGLVVSTTVMVCQPLVLLPHWSVAVHRRRTVRVGPQLLLTTSLQLMVTEPHPSGAVGIPVTFVRVSPGHWRTRLAGSRSAGGVVSRTVMVWTQLALLLQPSVAVQVRAITLAPPQVMVVTSL